MSEYIKISPEIRALGREAEREIRPYFERLEEICDRNTEKVLAAFAKNRVSDNLFAGTTGYGYDDYGRDTLDKIYADIFGTEAALVRIGFVNGTHALSCAMFSAVKTGDTVLSVTGPAYDTLQNTITGDYCGSMKSYGIGYRQVDLKNGEPDLPAIKAAAADENIKLVFIQRSRGYGVRKTLSVEEIGEICKTVREVNTTAAIMVDNCYGEFTEEIEPTQVGADIIAGSLIKNPGGGLAPTGGYIAGRADLVENASYKLTAPASAVNAAVRWGRTACCIRACSWRRMSPCRPSRPRCSAQRSWKNSATRSARRQRSRAMTSSRPSRSVRLTRCAASARAFRPVRRSIPM